MPITSNRDINYLSKDFDSIKSDLLDYVKRHFPNDWRDFNDASGGMAILELMAYVGDVLSFNIDPPKDNIGLCEGRKGSNPPHSSTQSLYI